MTNVVLKVESGVQLVVSGGRGGTGPNGAPGGNVTAIGLFTAATGMVIPSGTQVVETSGNHTLGLGRGRYIQDDTLVTTSFAAAHPTWTFRAVDENGAAHGWRLVPNDDGAVQFDAFGAYGNATFNQTTGAVTGTDDFPAFQAMDDFLASNSTTATNAYYRSLLPVRFGRRFYLTNSPLNLKKGSYRWIGSGTSGAQNGGYGTVIICAGIRGITLENYDTLNNAADPGAYPNATGAMGSDISDIVVMGANDTAGANRFGIWVRCGGVRLRNIPVLYFSDDGLRIGIGDGGGSANLGLADNSTFENIIATYNDGSGIKCIGGDSNANVFVNCTANSNGLFGIWDSSFLGNTWSSGELDGNGHGSAGKPWGTSGPSSFCSYAGKQYSVVAGQDGAASTTQPGTDATVWYYFADGAPNPPTVPAWVTGMTWKSGGPALFDNANSPSVITGIYVEGGLGFIQNPAGRAIILNGIGAQSVLGGKGAIYASNGVITFPSGTGTISTADPTYGQTQTQQGGGNPVDGAVEKMINSIVAPLGFGWAFNFTTGQLELRYGAADPVMMAYSGPASTRTYGRTDPVTNPAIQVDSLFIGTGNNAREITSSSAAPTSGEHAQGEVVFNISATAGGFVGWVCTAAGTPGTWKTFGAISA